jgi:hypothetical protein
MSFLGILAVIGASVLVGAVLAYIHQQHAPAETDLAAPYRESLEAAARIQAVALDLEQQVYAEAMRHIAGEPRK